jgi:hypothetical protein
MESVMAEKIIATIRNEPRSKVELLYDIEGWRPIPGPGNSPYEPMFILRVWSMDAGGLTKAKEIRLHPEEFELLKEAVPTEPRGRTSAGGSNG